MLNVIIDAEMLALEAIGSTRIAAQNYHDYAHYVGPNTLNHISTMAAYEHGFLWRKADERREQRSTEQQLVDELAQKTCFAHLAAVGGDQGFKIAADLGFGQQMVSFGTGTNEGILTQSLFVPISGVFFLSCLFSPQIGRLYSMHLYRGCISSNPLGYERGLVKRHMPLFYPTISNGELTLTHAR